MRDHAKHLPPILAHSKCSVNGTVAASAGCNGNHSGKFMQLGLETSVQAPWLWSSDCRAHVAHSPPDVTLTSSPLSPEASSSSARGAAQPGRSPLGERAGSAGRL